MTAALEESEPSHDRAHLQLLLARLGAAEQALAEEIADHLEVSERAALILARMRIEDLADVRGCTDREFRSGHGGESYCEGCWALLTPATESPVAVRPRELFGTCVYCGGGVS